MERWRDDGTQTPVVPVVGSEPEGEPASAAEPPSRDTPLPAASRRRAPFPWWAYVVAFVAYAAAFVSMLQWSMMGFRSRTTPWDFFVKMFTQGQCQFLLNLLVIGLVYAAVVLIVNRFWAATAALTVVIGVIAVLERMKVLVRSEAIRPTDITLLQNGGVGGMGDTATNMPAGSVQAIVQMSVIAAVLVAVCVAAAILDGRRALVATPRRIVGRVAWPR